MDISTMWDTIVYEYGIATEEELSLVTAIDGYNEDTLNNVIYVRTGYHDIYQLLEEESEVRTMLKVIYRDRVFIDTYKCIEFKKELKAWSYWQSGDLYYFKIDRFNYKVLGVEDTISIEELQISFEL